MKYMNATGQHERSPLPLEERDLPNELPDQISEVPDSACSEIGRLLLKLIILIKFINTIY